jgi:UDP-galactopyranose mutase
MEETAALIVGGGPAGLAVAHQLGSNAIVLEKEPEVGGLCRSIVRDGGVFDIGGHSFHTPHPDVFDLVDSVLDGGLYRQARDARVYSHGTLLPYPFQQHFDRIPDPDVVRECEEGLRAASGDPADAADFEEYILRKFGRGIARHFMLPYNRKLWARDITRISCEWTSERVAGAKGSSERFEEDGGKRKPLQAGTLVGYPQQGGFEEIFQSLARQVADVRVGREVTLIDPKRRTAGASSREEFKWDFLVSTMPIPLLVRTIEGVPAEIVEAADLLEYMSLRVELILVGRRLETEIQRIYVAESDVPPHKIAMNHNSSDSLRQRDVHAIMAEVSISPEKPVDRDQIAPLTIDFLIDMGVLESRADVSWTGHIDVKYAYPVYTHARPMLLETVRSWLSAHDIYTVGRFGGWEYINSDRCLKHGLDLGETLKRQYGLGA